MPMGRFVASHRWGRIRRGGRKDGNGANGRESGGYGLRLPMQVVDQIIQCLLVSNWVLPVAEIGDMKFANLAGRVLADVGIEILPFPYRLEGAEAYGKQDFLLLLDL